MSAPATAITRVERRAGRRAPTAEITPWSPTGDRHVCRAHVRLGTAPGFAFGQAVSRSLRAMAGSLTAQLGTPVKLAARLMPDGIHGLPRLAPAGAWGLAEIPRWGTRALVEFDLEAAATLLRRPVGQGPVTLDEAWKLLGMLWRTRDAVLHEEVWREGLCPRVCDLLLSSERATFQLEPDARHLEILVRAQVGDRVARLRVLVPGRAVEGALLRCGHLKANPPASPSMLATRLVASVTAGSAVLPLWSLTELGTGEWLPVADLAFRRGRLVGAARLRTTRFEARGLLEQRGLRFSWFTEVPPPPEVPVSDDALRSLLPIEVQVELARLSLPLSQVATLRPGAVLPLRHTDGAPVTLRIGDRAIARAELVDIDGQVGARVLQLVNEGGGR